MPPKKKTGIKGKGKAKGKGKGKGKGKKKTRKNSKGDKELIMKEALSNAKLWEARYVAAEKSRQEYRENAKALLSNNEMLQSAVDQTERDTIEVIAYLKKEDTGKEEELNMLRHQVKDIRVEAHKEKDALTEDYSKQIVKLEASLSEKDEEIRIIQGELKTVKEFRKKRGDMQQQLEQLQQSLEDAEQEHKKTISELEYKFFEEKIRLQKEANRRIADLAGKAHDEAVSNLDERTREVYRNNLHMAKALTMHMEHEKSLQVSHDKLEMSNRQLVAEKELNQKLVKGKISQARAQKKYIKELQEKVIDLEQSLTMIVKEFEKERHELKRLHLAEHEATIAELVTLQRRCQLQEREMAHIKRLARRILDQRSEVEVFFLEALNHVRKEISANRDQYRHDAQHLYRQRMLTATRGKGRFPFIRTFKSGLDSSTNSVYQDMEQANSWDNVGEGSSKVEMSDLTWEQKEQVLKLLFIKMNTSATLPKPLPHLPSSSDSKSSPKGLPVFITQTSHSEGNGRTLGEVS